MTPSEVKTIQEVIEKADMASGVKTSPRVKVRLAQDIGEALRALIAEHEGMRDVSDEPELVIEEAEDVYQD